MTKFIVEIEEKGLEELKAFWEASDLEEAGDVEAIEELFYLERSSRSNLDLRDKVKVEEVIEMKEEKKLEFEIYYADLTELAQKELLRAFRTFEEEENWTDSPLCVIEREAEEREYEDIKIDPDTLRILRTRYNEDREDR